VADGVPEITVLQLPKFKAEATELISGRMVLMHWPFISSTIQMPAT
jgi:hypothetical protein